MCSFSQMNLQSREGKKTEGLEIGRGGRRSKRVRVGVGGVCSG